MPKTQQTVDRIPFTKEYINIYWHTKLHDSQNPWQIRPNSFSKLDKNSDRYSLAKTKFIPLMMILLSKKSFFFVITV